MYHDAHFHETLVGPTREYRMVRPKDRAKKKRRARLEALNTLVNSPRTRSIAVLSAHVKGGMVNLATWTAVSLVMTLVAVSTNSAVVSAAAK
jgi:hypothetical protein